MFTDVIFCWMVVFSWFTTVDVIFYLTVAGRNIPCIFLIFSSVISQVIVPKFVRINAIILGRWVVSFRTFVGWLLQLFCLFINVELFTLFLWHKMSLLDLLYFINPYLWLGTVHSSGQIVHKRVVLGYCVICSISYALTV